MSDSSVSSLPFLQKGESFLGGSNPRLSLSKSFLCRLSYQAISSPACQTTGRVKENGIEPSILGSLSAHHQGALPIKPCVMRSQVCHSDSRASNRRKKRFLIDQEGLEPSNPGSIRAPCSPSYYQTKIEAPKSKSIYEAGSRTWQIHSNLTDSRQARKPLGHPVRLRGNCFPYR